MPVEETKNIHLKGVIRLGDSAHQFNIIMREIINKVKKREEYRMGAHKITII